MTKAPAAKFRLGLRARLFIGLLTVTMVISAGFALAMYEFVEILEKELLHHALARELDGLVIDYKSGAAIAGRLAVSDRVFVVEPSESSNKLPMPLRSLQPGEKATIHVSGLPFYAGRRDVHGAHIYLMLSVGTVEALERRLSAIGWVTFVGALLVALLVAILCGRWILKPVQTLAKRVTGMQPGESSRAIAKDYGNDRTMHAIAKRFDDLAERFRLFAEREQAFTQDASHELRTPLAVTLSTTELLLDDPDITKQGRDRIRRIHDAGHRMQRLVDALLFLARDQPCRSERCDMADIIDRILPFYSPQIQEKNITLETDMTSVFTDAPPGMADCVLRNLIQNAVEHTDGGRIDIRAGSGMIHIRDTGSGIDARTLQHIYERRYHTPQSSGLGIGLYLVHRVCSHLGWGIDIQSRIHEGTAITLTFPGSHTLDSGQT